VCVEGEGDIVLLSRCGHKVEVGLQVGSARKEYRPLMPSIAGDKLTWAACVYECVTHVAVIIQTRQTESWHVLRRHGPGGVICTRFDLVWHAASPRAAIATVYVCLLVYRARMCESTSPQTFQSRRVPWIADSQGSHLSARRHTNRQGTTVNNRQVLATRLMKFAKSAEPTAPSCRIV
jgi:hypothetical protein